MGACIVINRRAHKRRRMWQSRCIWCPRTNGTVRLYLTGGQQKALADVVALVREQFVQRDALVLACLTQTEQMNVDALAQDVLHHDLRLAGDRTAEQLLQVLALENIDRVSVSVSEQIGYMSFSKIYYRME